MTVMISFARCVVSGGSMLPLLCPGDRLLVWRQAPLRLGDVVVFRSGAGAAKTTNDTAGIHRDVPDLYVKRIVGMPGGIAVWDEQRWSLGTDEYFVVGDNWANSTDSRHLGPIDASSVIGRVLCTYYPQLVWLPRQRATAVGTRPAPE